MPAKKKTADDGKAKKTAPKKPKIVIDQESPVLSEYLRSNDRVKFLEQYTWEIRNLLNQIYQTEGDSKLDVEFKGNGTESTPTIFFTKREKTSIAMPRTLTPELELFLEKHNASHLISTSKPSSALYVRNPNGRTDEIKKDAHGEFLKKYHTLINIDSMDRDVLASTMGELLARDYWTSRKEMKGLEAKMDSLKPLIAKELPDLDTSTYTYAPYHGVTFSVQNRAGGVKTLDKVLFVEIFGEENLRQFGEERTSTYIRIESEAERDKRLEMMERKNDMAKAQQDSLDSLFDDDSFGMDMAM